MSFSADLLIHEDALQKYFPDEDEAHAVTIESLMEETASLSQSENTVAIVIVLSIKHVSSSRNMSHNMYTANGRKRQKQGEAYWNRIFMCGDLRDNGHCFVIIASSSAACKALFGEATDQCPIVGTTFAMIEPTPSVNRDRLGTMPIISSSQPLIPLRHCSVATPITEVLPETRLPATISVGEQSYFVLHNKTLQLRLFELTKEGTCGGIQCDKASFLESPTSFCGCMYTHASRGKYVGQCVVSFENPFPQTIHEGEFVEIPLFRSLRLTEMFFVKLSDYARQYSSNNFRPIRNGVTAMVRHINENGGWTVVGWFRRGEIGDASNEADKVENNTMTFHIGLIIPTSRNVLRSPEFRAFKLATPQNNHLGFII